ncbi:MAG: hypothetical protein DRN81_05000 [Thermoproteota archaeon]|nr:MAG: hypothetical protein DRN81_05000 [Candidatus Korarchaeota archaeon]
MKEKSKVSAVDKIDSVVIDDGSKFEAEEKVKVRIFGHGMLRGVKKYVPHTIISLPKSEARDLIDSGGACYHSEVVTRLKVERAVGVAKELRDVSIPFKAKKTINKKK